MAIQVQGTSTSPPLPAQVLEVPAALSSSATPELTFSDLFRQAVAYADDLFDINTSVRAS